MRRIGRYMLNAMTVVSLVLCVATVGLWVRSYWRTSVLTHVSTDTSQEMCSDAGHVSLLLLFAGSDEAVGWEVSTRPSLLLAAILAGTQEKTFDGAGVAFVKGRLRGHRFYFAAIPHGYAALLAAVLPVTQGIWRWRRGKRVGQFLCPRCGYDLRATPTRCPECGSVPTKA